MYSGVVKVDFGIRAIFTNLILSGVKYVVVTPSLDIFLIWTKLIQVHECKLSYILCFVK